MSSRIRVYSIESRKGGVGKTTIALNLAKSLLSRGPVLLLDCDITGTSISEPAIKSVYWQDVLPCVAPDIPEGVACSALDLWSLATIGTQEGLKKDGLWN